MLQKVTTCPVFAAIDGKFPEFARFFPNGTAVQGGGLIESLGRFDDSAQQPERPSDDEQFADQGAKFRQSTDDVQRRVRKDSRDEPWAFGPGTHEPETVLVTFQPYPD
jgi:hypothetical protein